MRIAMMAPLVSPLADPPLGGAQTMVADLAAGLTARGHEVQVYAASGSRIEGATVVDTGVDPTALRGTRFHEGTAASAGAAPGQAFSRVLAMVDRAGCDLVHNHAFDLDAFRAARGARQAVVHTLHLPLDTTIAAELCAARSDRRPPVVIAVSHAQASSWQPHLAVDAVIPNGVPTQRIPWTERAGPAALFAGRLSPEKGCREAIEIALRAGVDIDVHGEPYDREYERERIRPLALRAGVRLHVSLGRAALWTRMGRAIAVLCPVMWDEPFGLVAAEAQAAGSPVIGHRRGGLVEVVEDGITGTLVEPGDLDAAAAALREVGRISRSACRLHAETRLDLAPVLDAHERLYRAVVAAPIRVA